MTIGADVSKDELVTSTSDGSVFTIRNSKQDIAKFLLTLESGSTIAMEATGKYHKALADMAFSQGFKVVVFNPKDVLHYAKSISPRAKTDRVDARVIAHYALARPNHHTYKPVPPTAASLRSTLQTRSSLVASRVSLANRLRECSESESYLQSAIDGLTESVKRVDKEIRPIVRSLPQHRMLDEIPGFGPVVAPYILALLASTDFRTSDSFVAFIGLDIRVRQSGKKKGKSCLSKRGDPEARRLLYLAAKAASRCSAPFRDLYLRHQLHGMPKIAALNAVARKLARTAWSIYTYNEPYNAERVLSGRASLRPVPEHDRAVSTIVNLADGVGSAADPPINKSDLEIGLDTAT